MTRLSKKIWLSGVAAAVLLTAGLTGPVHADDFTPTGSTARKPQTQLSLRDPYGNVYTSKDMRKGDSFFREIEGLYRDGVISEADFNNLSQMRVNEVGNLWRQVSQINVLDASGTLKTTQQEFNAFLEGAANMREVVMAPGSTSQDIAQSMTDMLKPGVTFAKDYQRDLQPFVMSYLSMDQEVARAYSEAIQRSTIATPSEKRNATVALDRYSSFIRLSAPSNIGTRQRELEQAVIVVNDTDKMNKARDQIAQAIEVAGGPEMMRDYIKAAEAGDAKKAQAILDQAMIKARNAVRQSSTHYTNCPATGCPTPTPTPASTTTTVPTNSAPRTQPEPTPPPQTTPTPPPRQSTPRPTTIPVQNADGSITDRTDTTGLRVPQATQDALAAQERAAAQQRQQEQARQRQQQQQAAQHDADAERVRNLPPIQMNEVHRDQGYDGSNADGELLAMGLDEFDGKPFIVDDEDFPIEGAVPVPTRTEPYPDEPTYHEGDGSFTREGQNGYYELPDGRTVIANADGGLPEYHEGDGSFTVEGQNGYYEDDDGVRTPAPRPPRHVAGDGSFTVEGRNGYDIYEDGYDSNEDPDRLTANQTRGARDGQFSDADAFSAAMAVLAQAIDDNNQRILDESDAAMDRWDAYAEEVYYDEQGNIHRVQRERPANDYVAPPRDTRSATQIDRDNGAGNPWHDFEPSNYGRGMEVADLEMIYAGYDIDHMAQGSSGRSLSSAGTSLSSAGNSLRVDWTLPGYGPSTAQLALDRANGLLISAADEWHTPTDWPGLDIGDHSIRVSNGGRSTDPALASLNDLRNTPGYDALYGALHGDNLWNNRPLAETSHDLAEQLYGPLWSDRPYRIQTNAAGDWGGFHSGIDVATLSGLTPREFRELTANGTSGLERLLAQPFNVLLTWGAGAYDLDLHMTGPLAEGSADRFHIYYAARGKLDGVPFAELIKDCICNSGSEVILTSALVKGQVYRISVFNYGNQSAGSSNLATAANAHIQIVRGGVATSTGDGTTIVGGHVIYEGSPTTGGAGNTWTAVEIDPNTGRIRAPDTITQNSGSDNVH